MKARTDVTRSPNSALTAQVGTNVTSTAAIRPRTSNVMWKVGILASITFQASRALPQ